MEQGLLWKMLAMGQSLMELFFVTRSASEIIEQFLAEKGQV